MRNTLKLADRLVFRKLRVRFGDRLRLPVSGAAPLGKELAEFFEVIGMPIVEGYGLTEGGIVILNPLDRPRPGSIGKPLPGVEIRLAPDGELLVRAPCLFTGYFNDPKATLEVLRGGWLYTGDTAEIDAAGFIYITGRKKEVIISSNGKKIYPVRIEGLFKLEPIINHVVPLGDGETYVAALLTINTGVAETLKGAEHLRGRPMSEIVSAPPVVAEVKRAVAHVNAQLAPFEQIRRYRILDRELTIQGGELTATLKIRRSRVLSNYRAVIEELYIVREN
jgi:long-chain acyl-CoA synthetase